MKIHIIHTIEDQSENSDKICCDIIIEILDKMFDQEDVNHFTTKKNLAMIMMPNLL